VTPSALTAPTSRPALAKIFAQKRNGPEKRKNRSEVASMGRPKALCGTAAAARRHERLHEPLDDACRAALDAEKGVGAGEPEPRPLAMLPGARVADEKVDLDARSELLANMALVRAAMEKVTEADPLKIGPLSKRHSELVAELRALGAAPPAGGPVETPREADPFEQLFGPGGAPRRSATAPRT
jgi:hypothetical protein